MNGSYLSFINILIVILHLLLDACVLSQSGGVKLPRRAPSLVKALRSKQQVHIFVSLEWLSIRFCKLTESV